MVRIPPESVMFPGRGVSLRGQFYSRQVNGQYYFSKWPRRQPTPRNAKEADRRKLIALAANVTKYMSSQEQAFAADMSKRAKLLPRDFLMLALFGRLGVFVSKTGRKVYSMYAVQNVSEMLDALWQLKGGILVRGETWWEGLPAGAATQVLQMNTDGLPEWADIASGSNGLEAFTMPKMDPTLHTGLFGTGAFGGRSTFLTANTEVQGMRCWVQDPNGAHSIRAGLYLANPSGFGLSGGALAAQSNTQALTLGYNTLPFTAPYTVPADGWYYFGPGITGTGNVWFGALDYAASNHFWTSVAFPLPSTAPTATQSTSVNAGWWLY